MKVGFYIYHMSLKLRVYSVWKKNAIALLHANQSQTRVDKNKKKTPKNLDPFLLLSLILGHTLQSLKSFYIPANYMGAPQPSDEK